MPDDLSTIVAGWMFSVTLAWSHHRKCGVDGEEALVDGPRSSDVVPDPTRTPTLMDMSVFSPGLLIVLRASWPGVGWTYLWV
jgi:hypothetical protein